jgi:hypothetical protein
MAKCACRPELQCHTPHTRSQSVQRASSARSISVKAATCGCSRASRSTTSHTGREGSCVSGSTASSEAAVITGCAAMLRPARAAACSAAKVVVDNKAGRALCGPCQSAVRRAAVDRAMCERRRARAPRRNRRAPSLVCETSSRRSRLDERRPNRARECAHAAADCRRSEATSLRAARGVLPWLRTSGPHCRSPKSPRRSAWSSQVGS